MSVANDIIILEGNETLLLGRIMMILLIFFALAGFLLYLLIKVACYQTGKLIGDIAEVFVAVKERHDANKKG